MIIESKTIFLSKNARLFLQSKISASISLSCISTLYTVTFQRVYITVWRGAYRRRLRNVNQAFPPLLILQLSTPLDHVILILFIPPLYPFSSSPLLTVYILGIGRAAKFPRALRLFQITARHCYTTTIKILITMNLSSLLLLIFRLKTIKTPPHAQALTKTCKTLGLRGVFFLFL